MAKLSALPQQNKQAGDEIPSELIFRHSHDRLAVPTQALYLSFRMQY